MNDRLLRLATALLCVLLVACAIPVAVTTADRGDGIGGTGVVAPPGQGDTDGIGGTGHHGDPDDGDSDGLGGTGVLAYTVEDDDVALLGLVAATDPSTHASITLNGLSLALPADLVIDYNGRPAAAATLQVGQIAEVLARPAGDQLEAIAVSVYDAVVGPVAAVAADGLSFEVLGQKVAVDAYTRVLLQRGLVIGIRTPEVGDRVRVSGFRRVDGSIEATLIERAGDDEPALIAGFVSAAAGGGFELGGAKVELEDDIAMPAAGARVVVSGDARAGGVRASAIAVRPALPFDGRAARLIVQGYAASAARLNTVTVGALAAAVRAGSAADLALVRPDSRLVLDLAVDRRGEVELRRILPVLPQTPGADATIPQFVPTIPNLVPPPTVPGDLPAPSARPGTAAPRQGVRPPRAVSPAPRPAVRVPTPVRPPVIDAPVVVPDVRSPATVPRR